MYSEFLVGMNYALTALLALFQGLPDPATKACQLLQEQVPSAVILQGSEAYVSAITHNSVASQQNATCVLEPTTPEEVSTILQVIGRSDIRAPFSIRSGGHAFNPGHSSSSGVQISMAKFRDIDYDPKSKTVKFGTGLKWDDLYSALEPHGVNVVGGRTNGVGVGGFTLGGGWGWKSNQYGLTIDTVVAFDVVTATGKVLRVTETSEPDLFFGLKGGLNNFGIVTSITLETHPQTEVYGGGFLYSQENIEQVNKAVASFHATNKDPKAALLYTFLNVGGQLMASLQIVYDGPKAPKGMFDDILAIPATQGALFPATFTAVLQAFDYESPFGPLAWIPDAVPIADYPLELLEEIHAQVTAVGNRLQAAAPPGRVVTVSFTAEPMLDVFAHSRGGAYPHQAGHLQTPSFAFLWYTTNASVPYESQQEIWNSYSKDLHALAAAVREKAIKLGVSKPTDTLYANYAHADSKLEDIYGDNLGRLREIAAKYDPERVMTLTDGFLVQKDWTKPENNGAKVEL